MRDSAKDWQAIPGSQDQQGQKVRQAARREYQEWVRRWEEMEEAARRWALSFALFEPPLAVPLHARAIS